MGEGSVERRRGAINVDATDFATALEELQREQALERQQIAAGLKRGPSAQWCQNVYCGVEIPIERQRAVPGVQLCVDCQKQKERGNLK